jgi:hypothetical protein
LIYERLILKRLLQREITPWRFRIGIFWKLLFITLSKGFRVVLLDYFMDKVSIAIKAKRSTKYFMPG